MSGNNFKSEMLIKRRENSCILLISNFGIELKRLSDVNSTSTADSAKYFFNSRVSPSPLRQLIVSIRMKFNCQTFFTPFISSTPWERFREHLSLNTEIATSSGMTKMLKESYNIPAIETKNM